MRLFAGKVASHREDNIAREWWKSAKDVILGGVGHACVCDGRSDMQGVEMEGGSMMQRHVRECNRSMSNLIDQPATLT